jgi:hypothetical protein
MKKRKHAKGAGRRPGKGVSAYKPSDNFHNELVATWGDLAESDAGFFQQFFIDWGSNLSRSVSNWETVREKIAGALKNPDTVGFDEALEFCDDRETALVRSKFEFWSNRLIARLIQRDARFFRDLATIIESLTEKGGKPPEDMLRKGILFRASEVRRDNPGVEISFSPTKMQTWLRDAWGHEVADLKTVRTAMRTLGISINSRAGRSSKPY